MTKHKYFPLPTNSTTPTTRLRNLLLLGFAMVYYFTSNVVSPSAFIYVGKDKFESRSLDSLQSPRGDHSNSVQMRI